MDATGPPPTRRVRMSLGTKLVLLVFLATTASAAALAWISLQATHATLRDGLGQRHTAALDELAPALRSRLAQYQAEIEAVATERRLLDALGQARRRPSTGLAKRLASSARSLRRLESLVLVAPDGSALASAGSGPALSTDGRAQLAGGGPAPLRLLPAESGELALFATAPVGPGETPAATLVGAIPRAGLEALLEARALGDGAQILLVDGDGRVAAASALPGESESARVPPEAGGSSGRTLLRHHATQGGARVVLSSEPVAAANWRVVIRAPFDAAFQPLLSLAARLLVASLCAVALFSGIAYKVTTDVRKPIEALSNSAMRIAQGQLDLEIPEPTTDDEIGLLTRTFNQMMRRLRSYQVEIETTNRALMDRNEVLSQLSITDGLTKLHNHRYFQDYLGREIKRVKRTGEPLSMLMVDIDDFKRLNDRMGHAAGDELLAGIARIMTDSVRETDLLARYGGEEFVVLAPGTDLAGAYNLAEKFRSAIAETSFILDDSLRPSRITVSIGAAQLAGNRRKFFQHADRALYWAKAQGKNCVVVYSEEEVGEEKRGGEPVS
ncbi:MAG: diguanylate cyclase [Myxococcota bacterium]